MESTVELVCLDMAGTTLQDEGNVEACFAQTCKDLELNVSDAWIKSVQGLKKKYCFELIFEEELGRAHSDFSTYVDRAYDRFREVLEAFYTTHTVVPTEGCLDLFDYLKSKGIKIALTTGFYRKIADIILDKLGWLEGLNEQYVGNAQTIIQASITSDEVEFGRPEPYMIQKAMHLLGVRDPQKVIKVGDTPSDLAAGLKANCLRSLAVVNGTHSRSQLQDHENHGLLAHLGELQEIIEAL